MFAEIAIVNHSTHVSEVEMRRTVAAIGKQLAQDYATSWSHVPPALAFYPVGADVPAHAVQVVVCDDADQAGLLGYHTNDAHGPHGFVFVGPILVAGGTVMIGSLSVSCTLSHEVLELIGDPFCTSWADMGDGELSYELSDPVEADSYEIDGVSVSNFVFESYFDPNATPGAKFDFMGRLTTPFSMSPGGYQILRDSDGVHQVFDPGATPYAVEKKRNNFSRSARRIASAG